MPKGKRKRCRKRTTLQNNKTMQREAQYPRGRHHCRTLDIVGVQPGGGPRALLDVVVTEAYKSSASTHIAGPQWEVLSRESSDTTLTSPAAITSYRQSTLSAASALASTPYWRILQVWDMLDVRICFQLRWACRQPTRHSCVVECQLVCSELKLMRCIRKLVEPWLLKSLSTAVRYSSNSDLYLLTRGY
eukprot:SM000027S09699  [mRNA]  locus=s27:832848:833705:- [translate_table: standard]